ncbi:MAG: hypothetical protein GKR96_04185 [Gammaproteobacteria bacterium]|nr:hypothetical protein [Gammaproteobacteria bacterium]
MPSSTVFSRTKADTRDAVKFATDSVTGAFVELTEVKDLTNDTVAYHDSTGAAYTLGANETVADYVQVVALGNEVLSVTGGTPGTLTRPALANYAYMNVNGTDAMYAHGVAPVADTDHRVTDGGRIELQSAVRMDSFQLDALDGATAFKARVYYYNTNPDAERS